MTRATLGGVLIGLTGESIGIPLMMGPCGPSGPLVTGGHYWLR